MALVKPDTWAALVIVVIVLYTWGVLAFSRHCHQRDRLRTRDHTDPLASPTRPLFTGRDLERRDRGH